MIKIYPYKHSSKSAKSLAQQLACKRIKLQGSRYRPKNSDLIINWGNSHQASWMTRAINLLNLPSAVQSASNKLKTFQILKETNVPIPEFTTSKEQAKQWLEQGNIVFARETLTGNSGQGIVLMQDTWIETDALLYTKYTKCKHEFRIHVVNGEIIDYVQKKKRYEAEANRYIRSHNNGWIFAREDVSIPEVVKTAALNAIVALGLDFGAVDIGYKTSEDKAFVYEVNTAPGIEGTTLQRYTEAFRRIYDL